MTTYTKSEKLIKYYINKLTKLTKNEDPYGEKIFEYNFQLDMLVDFQNQPNVNISTSSVNKLYQEIMNTLN